MHVHAPLRRPARPQPLPWTPDILSLSPSSLNWILFITRRVSTNVIAMLLPAFGILAMILMRRPVSLRIDFARSLATDAI